MGKRNRKFSVIKGGRFDHKVYAGRIGQTLSSTIVAKSENEAYALLLDQQYGHDIAGVFAEPETDAGIIRQFRNQCTGVYKRPSAE